MKKKVKRSGCVAPRRNPVGSDGRDLHPQFLGYSLHICGFHMHEYQSFDHVLKVRSLTCAIAERPVLGEQFTELRFAAFKMISHLGKGYV
jgi:hypothetical protein